MQDHETPIMEQLASVLEDVRHAAENEAADNYSNDRPYEDEGTIEELVLSVETEIVRDVMLGVGGPTTFVRFIWAADNQERGIVRFDLKRCEFHYSWGADGRTSVTLNDDETATMMDAFGWMVGVE